MTTMDYLIIIGSGLAGSVVGAVAGIALSLWLIRIIERKDEKRRRAGWGR